MHLGAAACIYLPHMASHTFISFTWPHSFSNGL
jgi:hypothetical protein